LSVRLNNMEVKIERIDQPLTERKKLVLSEVEVLVLSEAEVLALSEAEAKVNVHLNKMGFVW
jgi:hypothetical protein